MDVGRLVETWLTGTMGRGCLLWVPADRCDFFGNVSQAQLLLSLVPGCRDEPDSGKCRELYELLTIFMVKGPIVYSVLCAGLPALSTPAREGNPGVVDGCSPGAVSCPAVDVEDAPLPGQASHKEKTVSAIAGDALLVAVTSDGNMSMLPAIPLLVWLMRLVVQSRVTVSDGHLWGLLSLTRVLVQPLGPSGKEEVGLRGLRLIEVPPLSSGGRAGRDVPAEIVRGRQNGLLFYVYYDCLFDIATDENHGPLAPPKCRFVW